MILRELSQDEVSRSGVYALSAQREHRIARRFKRIE